jgi:hypothetical protein
MNGKLILKNPLLAYFMKPKTRYPIKKKIQDCIVIYIVRS